jgi:putative oxidoreductase
MSGVLRKNWGFDFPAGPATLQVVQRLYSTFARGLPGTGLLCLRLITAAAPFHCAGIASASGPLLLRIGLEAAAGLLLCIGLWTPIAGGLFSLMALWCAISGAGDAWSQMHLAVMGAALAMLGPGAWSIDARLFGRKRLIHEP